MFVGIINAYCDYIIQIHKNLKTIVNPKSIEDHILSLTQSEVLQFIEDCDKTKLKLYPTRKERYILYKKLNGKDSPIKLFSYGKEKSCTRKFLIIKKKNYINE